MEQSQYPKYMFFENQSSAEKFLADEINNYVRTKPNSILSFESKNEFCNLYSLISKTAKETQTLYKNVILFCPSEICPKNTDNLYLTCYSFLSENFASKIDINWDNFFCMFDPSIIQTPNTQLVEFEKYLEQQDNIDILVLGVEEDGSLLKNFPSIESNSKTRITNIIDSSNDSTSNYYATLGLETISKSKKIYILMFGKNKSQLLSNFFFGNGFDSNLPISCLRENPNTIIIADLDAAEIILTNSKKSFN